MLVNAIWTLIILACNVLKHTVFKVLGDWKKTSIHLFIFSVILEVLNVLTVFSFKGHIGTTATKKIDVYLSMQIAQEKVHPMTVVTIANARVHDLIGLICWQYTSEGREPKLRWV